MLKLHEIRKQFGELTVLDGIDLEVEKGDVIAILGPSGSGKTTLLRCLNFLERADSGTLEFDGETYDLAHITNKEIGLLRKKTGFVFQSYNLFLNKTALQNVTEGLITARRIPKKEAEAMGKAALARVGLADRCGSYPHELSGGQQQRVAIARAIVTNPEIIYFDEPTSALDPELTGEVLNVIRDLAKECAAATCGAGSDVPTKECAADTDAPTKECTADTDVPTKGMTMLVVTHELGFAKSVSNKVVFMEDGHIVESGPSEAFFTAPQNERTREFLRLTDPL